MIWGLAMQQVDEILECAERQQEVLALLNMLGYAQNIAKDVGIEPAANYINEAVMVLLKELQSELPQSISGDQIVKLSRTRSGTC